MNNISIIAPIKKPDDILAFANKTSCRNFYVYHHKFLNNNFNYVQEFVDVAQKTNSKIYINFKHNISEEDLAEIKKFITFLKTTKIDGIFVNSFTILEAIKTHSLPFNLVIDSYFEIHNLAGIDFVNNFHKVDKIIITEEIYMKNITKIHQYKNLLLAIDSDNLPWCAEDIIKTKAIENIVIKGKFATSEEILEAIELIQKILDKPKMFKNQKLPFKHVRKSIYQTNHFSGEILSAQGQDFKFSQNIQQFKWIYKRSNLIKDFDYKSLQFPKINLRLTSLEQIKELKKLINKLGFNPVYSIEYGEILNTKDLSKSSFYENLTKVKKFCFQHDIALNISTPRVLIERDFERVYEYVKQLCLKEPHPESLIINNIGYFWTAINDNDLQRISIEIGNGINLLSSMSIACLYNLHPVNTIDFTSFQKIENIKNCIKKIKNIIPNRKITIAGNVRIPTLGLCPLNNDSAIVSRLACKAPCQKGEYAIKDPSLNTAYPFTVDGFCHMHMFNSEILYLYDYIEYFEKIGLNEFVIDLSSLPAKFVSILLIKLLNYKTGLKQVEHNSLGLYNIP